jgi:hypothetical protein
MKRYAEPVSMKKLATLSLLLLSLQGISQQIPLDTWRSHFSYSSARLITQANNTLVCVAQNGLFLVDIDSREMTVLGKENGLGDVAASAIHFSPNTNKLIIGYESGTIDIIDEAGNIINVHTFRDSPIVGNKRINDIETSETNAYMATALGILRVNLSNNTVIENYRNIGIGGQPINASEVTVKGDSLYAITADGIQSGNVNDNLLDFNDWTYFSETSAGGFKQLIVANNGLIVLRNENELWDYNGTEWQPNGVIFPDNIVNLQFQETLYALSANAVFEIDPLPVSILTDALLTSGNEMLVINNSFWIADDLNGLLQVDQSAMELIPPGPINDNPSRIKVVNESVYALFGPRANLYNGNSDGLGYSTFTNGRWSTKPIPSFSNITDVSNIGNNVYFSSMGFGIYSETGDNTIDETNSIMKEGNSFNGVQISALDNYENKLWALSYNAPDALYRINSDQTIEAFTPGQVGFSRAQNMTISQGGLIWAIKSSLEGSGIGIYDPITDQNRTLRSADGLPSSFVNSLTIDTDDEAWIGTSNGIANFSSASFPFNSFGASVPIFENGLLFENETINAVMTDGGNRIWVGTNEGVWVLSNDLTEVVNRFTTLTSPLPSDQVLSFAYEGNSGEVFILTAKGLVSYRSASSKAEIVHSSKVEVFPNPVRIGTDNVVGITGLAQNANVRITDTSGRLVKELNAVGGTASWSLDSFGNSKVNPGVYLIFSSTTDGSDTLVGKVAVLR